MGWLECIAKRVDLTILHIQVFEAREREREMGLNFSMGSNKTPASRVIEFHSSEEWKAHFEACKASSKLVVIDFSASWCGPCRFIEPVFNEMSNKYTDVEFIRIDVDELKDVAKEFGVEAMPTFILIKQGIQVDKLLGAKKDELEKMILKHHSSASTHSF